MVITNFPQTRHVFLGRNQHAVGPDYWLNNDGGNVTFIFNHVLDIFGTGNSAAGVGMHDWAFVAINFWSKNHAGNFASWFHGPTPRITGSSQSTHGRAVIGPITRDNFGLPGYHARDFESRFVGFSARGSEKIF